MTPGVSGQVSLQRLCNESPSNIEAFMQHLRTMSASKEGREYIKTLCPETVAFLISSGYAEELKILQTLSTPSYYLFKEDPVYFESYMAGLSIDRSVATSEVRSDYSLLDTSEPGECPTNVEIPWYKIELPPPGSYALKPDGVLLLEIVRELRATTFYSLSLRNPQRPRSQNPRIRPTARRATRRRKTATKPPKKPYQPRKSLRTPQKCQTMLRKTWFPRPKTLWTSRTLPEKQKEKERERKYLQRKTRNPPRWKNRFPPRTARRATRGSSNSSWTPRKSTTTSLSTRG